MLDGRFEATWRLDGSTLRVEPFEPLAPSTVAAVAAEGLELVRFVRGEPGEVRFGPR